MRFGPIGQSPNPIQRFGARQPGLTWALLFGLLCSPLLVLLLWVYPAAWPVAVVFVVSLVPAGIGFQAMLLRRVDGDLADEVGPHMPWPRWAPGYRSVGHEDSSADRSG